MPLKRHLSLLPSMMLLFVLLLSAPVAAQEPVTIDFWHVWGGPRIPMVEQLIADFEAMHPEINIEHTLIDQSGMAERYLTAIAGGDPPDVIMVHGGRFFPAFAERNALMDLTPYIEQDGLVLEDIYFQSDVEGFLWNGVPYGMPLTTTGGAWNFFYDVDAFEAAGLDPDSPPTTWAELEEYAAALTIPNDAGGFDQIGFNPVGVENNPFVEWLTLNNGKTISDDGRTILFNSPEGVETMEWLVGFYDRLYGGFENVIDLAGEPGTNGRNAKEVWYNGQVAMHVDGVWHLAQLEANAPDKNVRASLMPYNADNPDATVANLAIGGWAYSIPVGASNPDEAWEWMKYITIGEGNHNFHLAQLRPSPVIEHNADPAFAEQNPYWAAFIGNLEATVGRTASPVQAEIDRIIFQMTDEALFGNMSPAEAIEWGATEAQAVLDDYWASQ